MLAHSFPRWGTRIFFSFNYFRAIFIVTEGVPRVYPPLSILELIPYPAYIFLFNNLRMVHFSSPFLSNTSI